MRALVLSILILFSHDLFGAKGKPTMIVVVQKKHAPSEVTRLSQKGKRWHCQTEHGSSGWTEQIPFSNDDLTTLEIALSGTKAIDGCDGRKVVFIDKKSKAGKPLFGCLDDEKPKALMEKIDRFCRR